MKKKRIFVDMDGVLAVFHKGKSLEEISAPGYFLSLEPNVEVVRAITALLNVKEIEVFILSAVLSSAAEREKMEWLRTYLPGIDEKHIIFCPYGISKSDCVREVTGEIFEEDTLLDDFTKNLEKWHGIAIKFINMINNTRRSWTGYILNGNGNATIIKNSILALMTMATVA